MACPFFTQKLATPISDLSLLATCSENVFELPRFCDTLIERPANRGRGFLMHSHENSRNAWPAKAWKAILPRHS